MSATTAETRTYIRRPPILNNRDAEKAKPEAKPYQRKVPEAPGLVLRIQPNGTKAWKLIQNNRPQTIGRFPVDTYKAAVTEALRVLRGETPERVPEKVMTFGGYLKDHYQPYLEANSASPGEQRARLDRFGLDKKPLDEIRLADVETWRTKRTRAGRKASTINRDTNALRAALQRAVDWELIDANPLARLKPLKVDKQPVVRYLTDKEEKRLIAALVARDDEMRAARQRGNDHRRERGQELMPEIGAYADNLTPLVLLALNTGLRRGELWNLTWGDVDLRRKLVTVRGETTSTRSKTLQTRHVPLNKAAVAVLKAHKGDVSPLKSVPVFGRHEFKKAFASVLKAASVEAFRFHDTRHHFASKLVMAGVPLNTVRELLGHSDIKMTQRYAHLAPDNLRSAVELLGG